MRWAVSRFATSGTRRATRRHKPRGVPGKGPMLITWLSAALFLAVFLSPAAAQYDMEQETGVSVMARSWLSAIDPIAGAIARKEVYLLPMLGATLSIRPGFASNYSLLVTGFYGEGEGDILIPGSAYESSVFIPLVGTVPVSLAFPDVQGTTKAERMDFEFLICRTFPGKWFSLFFGPRYASWSETSAGQVGYTLAINNSVAQDATADLILDLDSEFFGFEFGMGVVGEMTDSGRHRLFSNFIFGAAYTEWESTGRIEQGIIPPLTFLEFLGLPEPKLSGEHFNTSLDANLGYQYSGDRLGFSARYRVFVLVEENVFEQTQFTTLHGPELGLSYTF
ncbi:MAG: hypothetical protein KJ970_07275 [Candidatus Eisenbacteria bacterium]|uniref:Uncharacterized protein n=1 Tax=Eiseniibacteriota bacterium TaxID=2212470 RepID=A0A948W5R5_UNCEI|nr:hypothetical protein [Candidatus Eisenbacteria bacterium]MBU1948475.1 hypothetical protein [Candidatus Eisenbacteria bacterium]MBU2690714.1 hypothetical protein [Candidatus Eisenbacteria bacterium]